MSNSVAADDMIVLVVGQVPPPVTGQSLMIAQFLSHTYAGMRLVHVPLEFSRTTSDIGGFSLRKLFILAKTLMRILHARWSTGASVLYYPPAGPNLVPVLRDLVLLLLSRPFFHRTVFHFHATGLCSLYDRLPGMLKPLFRRAYGTPDLAIFTTQATVADANMLHAKATAIVPCGAPDNAGEVRSIRVTTQPRLLFAGILCEGKGVLVLLQACSRLRLQGADFHLMCLGAFASPAFQQQVESFVQQHSLAAFVSFPGVLTGEAKHQAFAGADVFCFPSHYSAESFGVVLIEAMSYALPIVATEWQGIPEVTGERGTLLVPVHDADAVASALLLLLEAPDLRRRMGLLNRSRYLQNFTADIYCDRLEAALQQVHETAPKVRS